MESTIVISSNSAKLSILKKLSQEKKLVNIKFYTIKELKKKLFFDYDNKTLEYIMKNYNVSLSIAKMYIENIYFLSDVNIPKIKFLQSLFNDLDNHNLLIKDPLFKNYLQNKKIIYYGSKHLTKEEQKILNELKNVQIEFPKGCYSPTLYVAKDMEEELSFVATQISELLNKGISLNKIKVIIPDDYKISLKRIFDIYKIPINIDFKNSFYSTFIVQEFLANYDNMSLEDNLKYLSSKYSNSNDLIKVINKSADITDPNIRKYFIIDDLKNTYIKSEIYSEAINSVNITDTFNDDDYVFLLSFNINNYPKIHKDELYLNDYERDLLQIDTSEYLNKIEKSNLINTIKTIKNLVITYKLSFDGKPCYHSSLINDLNIEVKNINVNPLISYSKLASSLEYVKCLDSLNKFNIIDPNLPIYQNNIIIPEKYNNSFNGLNKNILKSYFKELSLSYTSIEKYNECAFKYYLSNILLLENYEVNFKTIIGNITHHILEIGLTKDIDITKEIMLYIKENNLNFNSKEYFFLEKLAKELAKVLEVIKTQNKHSKLNKYLFESNFYVAYDKYYIPVNIIGKFDKLMYNDDVPETIMVVDYKTGDKSISLDNIKYGLDMQLPIYIYLLISSNRFKNSQIGGFYIQKVLYNLPNVSDKTLDEVRNSNLRLTGYTSNNPNIMNLIDDDYKSGTILKNLKFKKDGNLDSRSKVISGEYIEDLKIQIEKELDKVITNILEGKFPINPKIIKNKNIACTYCKFKDICFKTKSDEVILGGEEDEVDY